MNFLKLNINDDNYNLSDWMIIYEKIGQRPNKIIVHDTFVTKLFLEVISQEEEKNGLKELLPSEDDYIINEKILSKIYGDIWISYVIIDQGSDNSIINDVCFYYKDQEIESKIFETIDKLSNCVVDFEKDSFNKFNTLTISSNSLELEPVYFDTELIDPETKYNDEIIKKCDKLIKKIKKSQNGISILCGEKGLGKTSMAKYITSKSDRMGVFIPNNMIDITINNPEFKNFLRKFEKIMIIIDDCEFLTNSQFIKISAFSNNLIQLVDGFLSETLNIQVLLIFNEIEEEIDENILEANSLLDCIEFDRLQPKLATELSKSIGNNKKYKESVKLVHVVKNKNESQFEKIGL